MLVYCWPNITEGGPTLSQHCVNDPCLLEYHKIVVIAYFIYLQNISDCIMHPVNIVAVENVHELEPLYKLDTLYSFTLYE